MNGILDMLGACFIENDIDVRAKMLKDNLVIHEPLSHRSRDYTTIFDGEILGVDDSNAVSPQ